MESKEQRTLPLLQIFLEGSCLTEKENVDKPRWASREDILVKLSVQ